MVSIPVSSVDKLDALGNTWHRIHFRLVLIGALHKGGIHIVLGYEHGRQLRSYLEHFLPHGVKWSLHQPDVEDAVTTTRLRIEHSMSHLPPLLTCSVERYNVNKNHILNHPHKSGLFARQTLNPLRA